MVNACKAGLATCYQGQLGVYNKIPSKEKEREKRKEKKLSQAQEIVVTHARAQTWWNRGKSTKPRLRDGECCCFTVAEYEAATCMGSSPSQSHWVLKERAAVKCSALLTQTHKVCKPGT